jgi:hypothetical protein
MLDILGSSRKKTKKT